MMREIIARRFGKKFYTISVEKHVAYSATYLKLMVAMNFKVTYSLCKKNIACNMLLVNVISTEFVIATHFVRNPRI